MPKDRVSTSEVKRPMQNPSRDREVSDLSYQGPLIGMRSTRPKAVSGTEVKKSIELEKPTVRQ